jgi:hypothetical protein
MWAWQLPFARGAAFEARKSRGRASGPNEQATAPVDPGAVSVSRREAVVARKITGASAVQSGCGAERRFSPFIFGADASRGASRRVDGAFRL